MNTLTIFVVVALIACTYANKIVITENFESYQDGSSLDRQGYWESGNPSQYPSAKTTTEVAALGTKKSSKWTGYAWMYLGFPKPFRSGFFSLSYYIQVAPGRTPYAGFLVEMRNQYHSYGGGLWVEIDGDGGYNLWDGYYYDYTPMAIAPSAWYHIEFKVDLAMKKQSLIVDGITLMADRNWEIDPSVYYLEIFDWDDTVPVYLDEFVIVGTSGRGGPERIIEIQESNDSEGDQKTYGSTIFVIGSVVFIVGAVVFSMYRRKKEEANKPLLG